MMVDLVHTLMRRSALGNRSFGLDWEETMNQIIHGCLRAVYEEGLQDYQSVVPLSIEQM